MLQSLLLSTLLLLLSACGQPGKVTETKFVISGAVSATPIDFITSQAIVTAFSLSTQQIVRVRLSGNTQSLTLPNGTWTFSVVHWDNLNTEGAQVRCGVTKEELTGEPVSLDVSVTVAECRSLSFNESQFDTGSALQPLELNQCATFGLASDNCDLTPGQVRSVKLTFPNILLSSLFSPALDVASGSVSSGCIDISVGDGSVNLATKLPSGSANAPIPFVIRAFSSPGCTGADNIYIFHRGLLSLDRPERRVHDYIPTNTTRILIRDGSIAALHAPLVLPAETSYKFNLNNFFTGGTTPYTFTQTGSCGSLTGSMFSGNGASTGGCGITATDANSNTATFTFSTVQKATHTIFSTPAAGDWPTLLRSTENLTLNSPGAFDLRSADIHRFSSFAAPAAPLVVTDRYLLLEKSSSNKIIDIADLTSGAWSRSGGIPSTPTPFTTFGPELTFFVLDKSLVFSGAIAQTLPTLLGNHVASVYLKKGTSRFSALKLVTPSSTEACRGLIVDLDNGNTTAMSGCPLMTTGPDLYGAQYVGDGWWRVWVTGNFAGTAGQQFVIYPAWSGGTIISPTEMTATTGSVSVLLPQIEGGDRPTSAMHLSNSPRDNEYITSTVPAVVNADLTSGSFVFDWHAREPEPNKRLLSYCNGTQTVMAIEVVAGKPRVAFPSLPTSLETLTLQDVSLESQNRIAFKIGSGQLKIFKRNDATPVSMATSGYSGARDNARMGVNCDGTSPENMGVRRFGYWATPFEDIVLKEMSNDGN